jgi:hypothetical protein
VCRVGLQSACRRPREQGERSADAAIAPVDATSDRRGRWPKARGAGSERCLAVALPARVSVGGGRGNQDGLDLLSLTGDPKTDEAPLGLRLHAG